MLLERLPKRAQRGIIRAYSCGPGDRPGARTIRNILDQVIMDQNLRTEDNEDDITVTLEDVDDYLADEGIDLAVLPDGKRPIGFV